MGCEMGAVSPSKILSSTGPVQNIVGSNSQLSCTVHREERSSV